MVEPFLMRCWRLLMSAASGRIPWSRWVLVVGGYATVITVSFWAAYEIRFEFLVPEDQQALRFDLLPWLLALKLSALLLFRQMGALMTYFSLPDLVRLGGAMLSVSGLLLLLRLTAVEIFAVPRGVLLVDFMLCFGLLSGARIGARLYRERLTSGKAVSGQRQQRVAIIGAGQVGARLANDFLSHPVRGFKPVLFLDDDADKHGKLVHGIRVAGRPELLGETRVAEGIDKVVIAMPSASAKRIREVVAVVRQANLKVDIVPSLEELASGKVKASRVRPVEVQDLLGRSAINLDTTGIRKAVEGKVTLVTGAGGSIGSELCRQIAALNPQRLLLVEQSEAALFLIEQELNEHGFGGVIVPLVADVLDRPRIEQILARHRPQVIFHAAAHKHVFLMERQPAEAVRNNAFGSRQMAELAVAYQAEAFVLISTDKAINPTNVMGATKRLAELLVMGTGAVAPAGHGRSAMDDGSGPSGKVGIREPGNTGQREAVLAVGAGGQSTVQDPSPIAHRPSTRLLAVRFGNVLGSSGSVIPIFKRQIENGGPVTVTHPEVTRYFMTIPEAVGLVLQSFVQGQGGEIFVLDMGQPVKIVDLAKQMIELSGFKVGDDIEIVFSGLKPGEKLFEELQHHTEEYAPTAHPRIMQFRGRSAVDEVALRDLERDLHAKETNDVKRGLQRLVPEYKPHLE